MAFPSTARRTQEQARAHASRSRSRSAVETAPAFGRAGPAKDVMTLAIPPTAADDDDAAPAVVVASQSDPRAEVPEIQLAPLVTGKADIPQIAHTAGALAAPAHTSAAARRSLLSILVSLVLHIGAAAAIVWLSWAAPPPISAGEEGIPVELVVAADTGAAAQQEAASGRQETEDATTDSQSMQKVEAPPVETPPAPSASDPVETASEEPPVAQPDPLTTAERILDQLPLPPMPELLPIDDRPAGPVLAGARTEPVTEAPAPPPMVPAAPALAQPPVAAALPSPPAPQDPLPQPSTPPDAAQMIDTPEPSEVQATGAPRPAEPPPVVPPTAPRSPPPPPPVQRSETPPAPPVRREATRPPPTLREASTTQERRRPTRQVAATAQPERPARAAPQAESRASLAQRGEGIGQRNRQQSNAPGASGASNVAAVAAWRQRVLAHLARYRVYPEQARERGIRGRTGVAFTLTGNGTVASVSIASSSGAAILDQATLAMVRRAQPFPPNPAGGSANFTAGINYSLY